MAEVNTTKREHAIVLGGSITGLLTARVLSDHFRQVTIIERDAIHDEPESRKGQPQTRHLHGLLEPIRRFMRQYFPGLEESLIEGGALVGDFGEQVRWYHFGGYKVAGHIGYEGITISRPYLEWHIRRRVSALPNVTLLAETAVEELIMDASHSRVTGVKVTRRNSDAAAETMQADLVVDASGRGSATPKWLVKFGFNAPFEEKVKINFGYTTRLYHREPTSREETKAIIIFPTSPQEKRGAGIFPIEGDRWIVTAGGWHGDTAPADEAGFLAFIRALPVSDIYDVICHAQPLSDIVTYNFPTSRRFRYDKLNRFPDGYFVVGDAVASFNPIYGQGMSSAAMQVEVLADILKQADLHDVWRIFFQRTAKVIDLPWQLSVGEDFRYPESEGKRPLGTNLINQYVARVHRATHHDPVVYRHFLNVMQLVAPPTSLLQPAIVWRVLRAS